MVAITWRKQHNINNVNKNEVTRNWQPRIFEKLKFSGFLFLCYY